MGPSGESSACTGDPGLRIARHYGFEAEAYRDLWAPVLVGLARWLIDELGLHGSERVLDLGCGVGALLPSLRAVAPETVVVGLDRTEGMVKLAPRTFPLVVGDAVGLPFRDRSFDTVTMVFMLFHVPQPSTALAEVRRVLRPGGRVGILTWGKERESRACAEWVRALDAAGAAEYGGKLSWHEQVDSPRKTIELLREAGFEHATARMEAFVQRPTCEEFLARRTNLGCCRFRLESLNEGSRRGLLERTRSWLGELSPDDFESRSEVIVTVGRR